jgi:hypothetical protein
MFLVRTRLASSLSFHEPAAIKAALQFWDKWLWATQLTDRESGKQLLNCKDVDFPYVDKAPIRCFPEVTQPSD